MEDELLLNTYRQLIPFLEQVIGPHAEIVLHDLRLGGNTIVAMSETSFTGRQPGDTISRLGQEISALAAGSAFVAGGRETTAKGHELRTNTFFIKNPQQELIGLLCLHLNITVPLQSLAYLQSLVGLSPTVTAGEDRFGSSEVEAVADRLIDAVLLEYPSPDRMRADEKREVLEALRKQSVFRIRGSVARVAEKLSVSVPTVYRYLKNNK